MFRDLALKQEADMQPRLHPLKLVKSDFLMGPLILVFFEFYAAIHSIGLLADNGLL